MGWKTRIVAAACAALVAGCQAQDQGTPPAAATDPPALPQLPLAEPPLDREALLLAVLRAASAAALGEDDGEVQRDLDGKRFALRLRFGCPLGAGAPATRTWSLDEARGLVRLEVGPEIERETPLAARLAGSEFEAVEGFWIRHPWLLRAGCPPAAGTAGADPGPDTTGEPGPRETARVAGPVAQLGIAQFYTAADARTHRRDSRAYAATETLSKGQSPSAQGYDLVVEGRLQALRDGPVIACTPDGERPPSCIVSARFEQISLERADNRQLIAEWPRG